MSFVVCFDPETLRASVARPKTPARASGLQSRVILPSRGTSGRVQRCVCLSKLGEKGVSDVKWAEARDAAKHPKSHKTATPHPDEELSCPKHQLCGGWEELTRAAISREKEPNRSELSWK